ncbi:MAG: hypothetical protein EBS53_09235 [Bacteroidetes bacterium]|nr:hypothetical protein [Bacteroidota bacterium]
MPPNQFLGRTEGFTGANFTGAFGNRYQHDVHKANGRAHQRDDPNEACCQTDKSQVVDQTGGEAIGLLNLEIIRRRRTKSTNISKQRFRFCNRFR